MKKESNPLPHDLKRPTAPSSPPKPKSKSMEPFKLPDGTQIKPGAVICVLSPRSTDSCYECLDGFWSVKFRFIDGTNHEFYSESEEEANALFEAYKKHCRNVNKEYYGCKVEKEKYFVACGGEEPVQIFFDRSEALMSEYEYIDSFDENGNKCISYKFDGNAYTTDF